MTELATVTFEERDGVFIGRLQGEIDMSNAESLTRTIGRSVSKAAAGMVLDLSDVTYLDSAGIRLLFELGRRFRQRGQRITLVLPDGAPIRRVLQLTDVTTMIAVCGTVEQAWSQVVDQEP
jgi:stage II sporulation protein AA (anti-sigma F factor antagonist)